MIVIKSKNVEVDENQLPDFKNEFENVRVFNCPNLIHASLKTLIDKQFSNTQFSEFIHKTDEGNIIGQEFAIPQESSLPKILNFYMNHKSVIEIVKKITGISEIKSFTGRVYKFEEDRYSYDSWHSDMNHGRLLGMSLNLSEKLYGGGEFKIRNSNTGHLYKTVKHKDWGSAHFFGISDHLEHKVEKVSGGKPRIAFAGWFNSQPLFN